MTGLRQEARIAARLGGMVAAGGGTREGAFRAAARLADLGAAGLVSFGVAGGLDPDLRPGAVIVPARVFVQGERGRWAETDPDLSAALGGFGPYALLGAPAAVASAVEKRRLRAATGCAAVDLESGAVAEVAAMRGLPFAALRVVCDPADLGLPPAALAALSADGGVSVIRVLASVLRQPAQIPDLLALARTAAMARRGLRRKCRQIAGRESKARQGAPSP